METTPHEVEEGCREERTEEERFGCNRVWCVQGGGGHWDGVYARSGIDNIEMTV